MLWWTLRKLKSIDYGKRAKAAERLGESKDIRAIDYLVMALEDENMYVRGAAAKALQSLDWKPKDNAQRVLNAIALLRWDELVSVGGDSIKYLVAIVESYSRYAKSQKQNYSLKAMNALFNYPSSSGLFEAIDTLGKIGDIRDVKPLVEILNDKQERISTAAAIALVRLGRKNPNPQAFNSLLITTGECVSNLNSEIVNALQVFWEKRSFDNLIELAKNSGPYTRLAAINMLCDLEDNRVPSALYATLKEAPSIECAEGVIALGGEKALMVSEVISKLEQSLPTNLVCKFIPAAIQIKEQEDDFEIIYEPERGHMEDSYFDAGSANGRYYMGTNWVVDSPEVLELIRISRKA